MKRNIISIIALLFCGMLHAQEEVQNAVVNVENDYNPTVVKVNKKNFTPTVEAKSNAKPLEQVFSEKASHYTSFSSEREAKEILPKMERPTSGYVRAGYGTANEIDAKLGYNVSFNPNSNLGFIASFDGFNSNIQGLYREWKSRMYNTVAAMGYTHRFKRLLLDINGGFNNRTFNYQRANEEVSGSDRQTHRNYDVNVKGVSQLAGPVAYSFKAGYTHSLMAYSATAFDAIAEQHINAGVTLSRETYYRWLRRYGAELEFNGFLYTQNLKEAIYGYKDIFSIDINPFTDFNFNNWAVKVGAKMNMRAGNSTFFAIAPDIRIDKNMTKNISMYALLTGGREDNSFKKIEGVTAYWGYDKHKDKQIKPTYRIIDARIGARMNIEPFSFDIYGGYSYTKDDLLQEITYSTDRPEALIYANPAQGNTSNAHAGIRLGIDVGGFIKIGGNARYDYWSCMDPATKSKAADLLQLKPEWSSDAHLEASPMKRLTVKAGYSFARYTKGVEGRRINDKHDLYLRANYNINRWFGAYIQGENLLNNEHYNVAGYRALGIRGLVGVTANF